MGRYPVKLIYYYYIAIVILISTFRYFLHPDEQIKQACEMIQKDANLTNGFNAIGFSQGAQFL